MDRHGRDFAFTMLHFLALVQVHVRVRLEPHSSTLLRTGLHNDACARHSFFSFLSLWVQASELTRSRQGFACLLTCCSFRALEACWTWFPLLCAWLRKNSDSADKKLRLPFAVRQTFCLCRFGSTDRTVEFGAGLLSRWWSLENQR